MFNRFIFKVAYRYFFARSSKTIVNRINRFAFIMIVVSACSLLVVLSAISGLKDFGLQYTNSFDPDYNVIQEVDIDRLIPDELERIKFKILSLLNSDPLLLKHYGGLLSEKYFLI